MKRLLKKAIATAIVAGCVLFGASQAHALTASYLDPNYTMSSFTSIPLSINSFTFDSSGNLYTVSNADAGTGTTNILRFDALTGYSTSSLYHSYQTTGFRSTGLDFNPSETYLFSSESDIGGDSGLIYRIDTGAHTESLYYSAPIRPTGIDDDGSGNVYFSGRLNSNPLFGNIYRLNPSMALDIIVPGFVGKGLAVDGAGNIFASDIYANLYRFDANTYNQTLIATFTSYGVGELAFGPNGDLYAFEMNQLSGLAEITRFSTINPTPTPEPSTLALLGLGATGLALYRKRKKTMRS